MRRKSYSRAKNLSKIKRPLDLMGVVGIQNEYIRNAYMNMLGVIGGDGLEGIKYWRWMTKKVEISEQNKNNILLLLAGICGCVGSTVCAAIGDVKNNSTSTLYRYLMTESEKTIKKIRLPFTPVSHIDIAGWDIQNLSIPEAIENNKVLPYEKWMKFERWLNKIEVMNFPTGNKVETVINKLRQQIRSIKCRYPHHRAIFVNLLPATVPYSWKKESIKKVFTSSVKDYPPDLMYSIAAILENVPLINFTSNDISHPVLIELSQQKTVPICGNDGKTGQTYFKMVLASAFAARCLYVDGWYSLNILGNMDGKNLSDPTRSASKIKNKSKVLEDILGYKVGQKYETPSNIVRIDYYPPRGDCKEAWDVIDFLGIFDMPMSLRINLQGRDSILAAPLIIDLARWMALIHQAKIGGIIKELAFYFKSPMGNHNYHTFQDQILALYKLGRKLKRNYEVTHDE